MRDNRRKPRPVDHRLLAELPPPERGQHGAVILEGRAVTDAEGRVIGSNIGARVMAGTVLDRLKARRIISPIQWRAGGRLYKTYFAAGISPSLSGSMERSSRGTREYSDRQAEARGEFKLALNAAGPGLASVAFDVACGDLSLESVEFSRGWPRGAAGVVLRLALSAIAAHYWTTAS